MVRPISKRMDSGMNNGNGKLVAVTDSSLIKQLDTPVTDPSVLAQLQGDKDPEKVRQENLAAADANREPQIEDILAAPGNLFNKGLSMLTTNPIAAAIHMAHGILQLPGAAIGGAMKGYEQAIEAATGKAKYKPSDAISGLFGLATKLEQGGEQTLDKVLPPEVQNNLLAFALKTTPDKVHEVADALSQFNQTAAQYVFPEAVKAGVKAVPNVVGSIARATLPEPERLASAAYKPSVAGTKDYSVSERPLRAAIDENIRPGNKADFESLRADIAKASDTFQRVTTQGAGEGVTIDFNELGSLIDKWKKESEGHLESAKIGKALDEVKERWMNQARKYPNGEVPLDVANNLKSQAYQTIGDAYDEMADFKKEADKKLANEIVNATAEYDPSLKALGLKQRDWIELEELANKRIKQLRNQKLIPDGFLARRVIYGLPAAAGGYLVGGARGAAIAGASQAAFELILDSPKIQFKLARMIDKARKLGLDPKPLDQLQPSKIAAISEGFYKEPPSENGGDGGSGGAPNPRGLPPSSPDVATFEDLYQENLRKRTGAEPDATKQLPAAQKQLPASGGTQAPNPKIGGEQPPLLPEAKSKASLIDLAKLARPEVTEPKALLPERTANPEDFHVPAFHLRSEEMVASLPKTIKAQSLKNQLAKLGVGKDEMEWTRIDDLVNSKKPDEKISQGELAEWIKNNKIDIQPRTLGEDPKEIQLSNAADKAREEKLSLQEKITPNGETIYVTGQPPSWSYRDSNTGEIVRIPEEYQARFDKLDAVRSEYEDYVDDFPAAGGAVKFTQYNPFQTGTNPREILLQATGSKVGIGKFMTPPERFQASNKQFTGGHFSDVAPNVAAHIRAWDLGDTKGNKVLGIGEIQSDWNIQVRKFDKMTDRDLVNAGGDPQGSGIPDVPDFPFKGTAWADLSLKYILRYAAENGYD